MIPSEGPSREQGARQKQLEQIRKFRMSADLEFVLSGPPGRRFLWELLGQTGMFTGGFINNGSEQYFRAGQRDLGLKLMKRIQDEFPESFLLMQSEAMKLVVDEKQEATHAQTE